MLVEPGDLGELLFINSNMEAKRLPRLNFLTYDASCIKSSVV